MPNENEQVVTALAKSYRGLNPLLRYLRARLKYDTARWLREYGGKDDIIFSTRTKSFARIYDKLSRKGIPITRSTEVLDLVLKGELQDTIGIRFVCFDTYNIFKLVSYFLITERVTTSKREFYSSSLSGTGPLQDFLTANGFSKSEKQGREYEDINFIMRFAHPIDMYFGSGADRFKSLAEVAEPAQSKLGRLNQVNALFEELKVHGPELIKHIPQFPIECQIVTATQHLYNRTQRPQYEYVLQRRATATSASEEFVEDVNAGLRQLKINLYAADHTMLTIHRKSGIQYQAPLQILPGPLFSLEGRLPRDVMKINSSVNHINDALVPRMIDGGTGTPKRHVILDEIFATIKLIAKAIEARARGEKDIVAYDLLQVADLPSLSYPNIVFWAYQRILLAILAIVLLYTVDREISKRVIASMQFADRLGATGESTYLLSDRDIVLGRLFETLEHMDHAVDTKLTARFEQRSTVAGWQDGHLVEGAFCDPLIQWRYASYMYGRQEYATALQELKVGSEVNGALERWKERGVEGPVDVPNPVLYDRRIVEYELCMEVAKLRIPPGTVAGTFELCNAIISGHGRWAALLQHGIEQSEQFIERSRCFCLLVLLKLCEQSAGGLAGGDIRAMREEWRGRFGDYERRVAEGRGGGVEQKSWWLLVAALLSDGEANVKLRQFKKKLSQKKHHPVERIQFEEVCGTLIEMWTASKDAPASRVEFTVGLLSLIGQQLHEIVKAQARSEVLVKQFDEIAEVLKELTRELREGRPASAHEPLKSRLGKFLGDTSQKVLVDLAVSGIKSAIGY